MSFQEIVIILFVGFLVLGPKDLMALAKTCIKALRKFRAAWQELENKLCGDDS